LFPKNPRKAVSNIAEIKTNPGICLATDGMMLSTEEITVHITKMVSPIGPIIANPCKKDLKNKLMSWSKGFFFINYPCIVSLLP
jgi:hypothetical protein